jgi:hypothetical protein
MSHTNVISVNSTELNNSGPIRVGSNLSSGTIGQVLTSQGRDKSPIWGTNSAALPNALTAGNHITFSSGNPSFDGSIADTINATPGGGLIGSNGIDISGATISTDNDGTTINNTGGTGTQNQVLRVPGTLTINQNTTLVDTFDGSTNKTINLVGDYLAGDGIDISGHPVPHIEADTDEITISHNVGGAEKLQVLKVPNTLTITDSAGSSIVYDGSSTQSITINDNDTTYTAGNGMILSGTTFSTDNDGITIRNTIGQNEVLRVPNSLTFTGYASGTFDGSSALSINLVDTDTQLNLIEDNGIQITNTGGLNRTIKAKVDGTTVDFDGDQLSVKKVPNALTAGTNISFSSGTTYDGSSAITISSTNTTYQGGTGISIDTTTNPDTINCNNIPNSALANSTISGISLGSNLSTITFYSNTGAFLTSYNGANPPTSVTLDGDTTYQGGSNISIDTSTNPDTINLDSAPTNLDLSSSTNTFPLFVGGSEILKSMSYIDNSAQNFNRIYNTSNEYFFSGSQDSGTDTLEIDFTATSTTGYCEYGFYANSLTSGMVFCVGIAAATGGTSPFSTTLTSSPVAIDAYKIGLFDGTTSTYSLKEILDFTGFENTYITSKFFFNNLSVGTRYRMALYGRCHNSGSIYINSGGKNTTGFTNRSFHQPTFMKFYEYDSSIGGARTTGGGGGGGI